MIVASLIAKKRDGHAMTEAEIQFLIDGYCRGTVADYQMSAFAMAVCLRGMSDQECAWFTRAMFESGQQLSRAVSGDLPRVDKHSSGGLGDKVSLILAPWLACCDVHVPMISGRGLGLTGGTLDKLEAIPGFQVDLDDAQSDQTLTKAGATIIARANTPLRQILNYAQDEFCQSMPLLYALTVIQQMPDGTLHTRGLYIGDDHETFFAASELAFKVNINHLEDRDWNVDRWRRCASDRAFRLARTNSADRCGDSYARSVHEFVRKTNRQELSDHR